MNEKVAAVITDRLLAEMEKGSIPWQKPWAGTGAFVSHSTGKPYSLVNQLILATFSKPGEFITWKQIQAEGGRVKPGAHSVPVTFWKQLEVVEKDETTGEETKRRIPVLRYYQVFNVDDCEGIQAKFDVAKPATTLGPIGACEKVLDDYYGRENAPKLHNDQVSDRAYYRPSTDTVVVPTIDQYAAAEEYYSTLFHESVHSTGHKSRLDRFTSGAAAAFGGEDYSREELVAEIGAAALLNICGAEIPETFRNSAAYIQGWSKALRDDKTLFITAASRAEKAINFILGNREEVNPV